MLINTIYVNKHMGDVNKHMEEVNKHRRCTAGFYIAVIQIN